MRSSHIVRNTMFLAVFYCEKLTFPTGSEGAVSVFYLTLSDHTHTRGMCLCCTAKFSPRPFQLRVTETWRQTAFLL